MRPTLSFATAAVTALALAGCSPALEPDGNADADATASTDPAPTEASPEGRTAAGGIAELATGLEAPWSILRLDEDRTLVSLRDEARIVLLDAQGEQHDVTDVEGVVPGGEGGLLGLAANEERSTLFVYFTAAEDNRVVAYDLEAGGGDEVPELGEPDVILDGIPKASNHNGGRLGVGPDGHLYIGTGDAGQAEAAQDPDSLAGKILRLTAEGEAPDDNPQAGSPVYSLGHRNPQGLAWDDEGRLWASEFGANTWDEINLIEPGGNYGWPDVEGAGGGEDFIDPVHQWATAEASPSGIAVIDGRILVASLRGERIWSLPVPEIASVDEIEAGEGADGAEALVSGEFGRIRDVVPGPEGTAWFLSNNTDGRGDPGADDDRLVELPLD